MNALQRTRPLSERTGEQLLMLAIAGDAAQRRCIEQELNLRSLLAEPPRRPRPPKAGPRLRLVGTARAA